MSENYPSDVKLNENPDGTVSFATEVIATIAGLAANEVDGVASMSSPSSGLADMFSRSKEKRSLTKGVRIDLDGEKVTVDVSIVVEYGSPVPDVARNLQENIKKAIETMSGLDVHSVDVHVTGISFEREQRANAELDEQQRKMLEKKEETASPETEKPYAAAKKPEPKPEPEPAAPAAAGEKAEAMEAEPEKADESEPAEADEAMDEDIEADLPEDDLLEDESTEEKEEAE